MGKLSALKARLGRGHVQRFAVSTVASMLGSLGLPVLLHQVFGVEQKIAVAISQCSVVVLNFIMIRVFVFQSSGSLIGDIGRYGASAVIFRGLEYIGFLILLELAKLYYFVALVVTLSISTIIKFLWYRFLFVEQKAGLGHDL